MNTATKTTFHSHPLVHANIAFLHQGLDMLGNLSNLEYTRTLLPAFPSGIGAHMRHVVDHYTSFFVGLDHGCIDYESRKRDSMLEIDRAATSAALLDTIQKLGRITEEPCDRKVVVIAEHGVATMDNNRGYLHSTVDRELQFLSNHTVHHYALIAVHLRLVGREPTKNFGVSPSTIRHVETLRSRPEISRAAGRLPVGPVGVRPPIKLTGLTPVTLKTRSNSPQY